MYGHLQVVKLEDWYQENKEGVTDWQTRMKELLGLTPVMNLTMLQLCG